MMKLRDAASYFDLTEARHPTLGTLLFKGQIDPYDDGRRDANAAYRRILSVRPGTVVPEAVNMMGLTWMVGAMEPDGLEELHRQKYVLQRASLQLKVSTLSGFLAGAVLRSAWASANWTKDSKQIDVSSETPQIFDVYTPLSSAIAVQNILWASGVAYLVLAPHPTSSGFSLSSCLKLDQVVPAAAAKVTRTYDPVTGAYTNSASTPVNALRVRWESLFNYGSQASDKYRAGDIAIALPTGTACTTSTLITLAGKTYQTLSVLDIAGAVVLHSRLL